MSRCGEKCRLWAVTAVLCVLIMACTTSGQTLNDRPIVGVLAEEIAWSLLDRYPDFNPFSHIAASYVKFVEGGGARPVPIWIGKSEEYYRNIMSNINGVLFPGGGLWFNTTKGYAEAGRFIYDIAMEMNEAGDYFPIWGTCLGYELLAYLAADSVEIRTDCKSQKVSLPLEFKSDFREGRLFKDCPEEVVEILRTKPVTPNFHNYCVTEQNLTRFGLDSTWRVMSLNKDDSAETVEFISTIEHRNYPFYGVQFHPEKVLYEWVEKYNISHLAEAAAASQYFARFFIDECRRSNHAFANYTEENRHMIYNFPVSFSALKGSTYQQAYLFSEDVDYPSNEGFRLGALTDKNDSITVMPLECTQDNATYNHRIYCHGDNIMAMVISPIVLLNSFQCCTEMMKC